MYVISVNEANADLHRKHLLYTVACTLLFTDTYTIACTLLYTDTCTIACTPLFTHTYTIYTQHVHYYLQTQ
jgi:hypothetical protein